MAKPCSKKIDKKVELEKIRKYIQKRKIVSSTATVLVRREIKIIK